MEPQTRPIGCSGSRLYRAPGVVGIVLWTKLKRTMWVVPYCLLMVSSLASIGPRAALHCRVTYPQNNEQSLFVHKWANMRGILSQRINQKSRYGWTHDDDGAASEECVQEYRDCWGIPWQSRYAWHILPMVRGVIKIVSVESFVMCSYVELIYFMMCIPTIIYYSEILAAHPLLLENSEGYLDVSWSMLASFRPAFIPRSALRIKPQCAVRTGQRHVRDGPRM